MADGVRTWLAKTLKLRRPSAAACLIATAEVGVVVSKPIAKKTTSRPGFSWARRSASALPIDHADVGALGAGLHQAGAVAARHPHHVAIGAQDDFRTAGEFDRHVEPADRQHADRAAGTVDHIDVGRQQVFDAVAADRVGVAAAELHDGVACGPDRPPPRWRRRSGLPARRRGIRRRISCRRIRHPATSAAPASVRPRRDRASTGRSRHGR